MDRLQMEHAMTMHGKNDTAELLVSILARAEGRLLKLLNAEKHEAMVHDLSLVLQDLVALRVEIEMPRETDQRSSARIHERAMVYLHRPDGRRAEAVLHDISAGGALIACDDAMRPGDTFSLQMAGLDHGVEAGIRAVKNEMLHVVFKKMDHARTIALVKHIDRYFLRY